VALFRDTADVSVRPAAPDDENAITRVQLRAWRLSHAEVLGAEVLETLDAAAVRDSWASAIAAPPTPAHRVLVACDGPRVVGFAATAPADADAPDAAGGPAGRVVEVVALEVDPDHQQGGHGSRLLAACVDLARQDGATAVVTWVLDGDPARERFLAGAGLGPDGATRDLATGTGTVVERRWAAEI
jgi:predicted N-acetyltransferase YhbS